MNDEELREEESQQDEQAQTEQDQENPEKMQESNSLADKMIASMDYWKQNPDEYSEIEDARLASIRPYTVPTPGLVIPELDESGCHKVHGNDEEQAEEGEAKPEDEEVGSEQLEQEEGDEEDEQEGEQRRY